ncbi:hypothetical protein GCM10017044_24510 [Kordiimonas sediminis]|uniref:Cyclic nucleotide-binding domain-containing protein n=2 Tax=Kordiimonas sediminis TaxID=1735581 RepID=A0A919AXM0_9PROT|nr:hypothetical protein GCM10017044_24510 [Kordiimonas sediminis]
MQTLATLSNGTLLGETSALEGSEHSVTAIATMPTRVLFVEAEAFRKQFTDPLVHFVVKTLASRVRATVENAAHKVVNTIQSPKSLRLRGDCEITHTLLKSDITISQFPFLVGNSIRGTGTIVQPVHALLPLPNYPSFSAAHFEIVRRGNGFAVRDLGTNVGVYVNGLHIKKYQEPAVAELNPGENRIEVRPQGDKGKSPLKFKVFMPVKD